MTIKIRKMKNNELDMCISLFQATVHHVNAKDYTSTQLNAWTPLVEPKTIDNYSYWQTLLKNYTYVAELNQQIVGFGDLTVQGYLDRLFIHKDFQGQGIATAIVEKLEACAKQLNSQKYQQKQALSPNHFLKKWALPLSKNST